MYLFKSKNGKIYAKQSPSITTAYDVTKTKAENEQSFFRTENEVLKKYGFKPTTWEKSLSEFIGDSKQLYQLIIDSPIPYKDDCYVGASKDIYLYLISQADEIFSNIFEDDKQLRLAFLYSAIGDEDRAKICRAKAQELFKDEEERLIEYRDKKYANSLYTKYLKNCIRVIDYACAVSDYSNENNVSIGLTKSRFIKALTTLGRNSEAIKMQKV